MKTLLFVFCAVILMAASGCIVTGRDHEDHSRDWHHDDHYDADHGGHPGDWDHHDNR